MAGMRRGAVLGISLILAGGTHASPELDDLLKRLAEHARRVGSAKKRSVTSTTRMETLDRHDRPESVDETVERQSWSGGVMSREVLRATKDGKDVTLEEKGKARVRTTPTASTGATQMSFAFEAVNPFAAGAQPKYRFTLLGSDSSSPSRRRVRFEPVDPAAPGAVAGEALVDADIGAPVSSRFRPVRLPRRVNLIETEVEYGVSTPHGPELSRMRSRVSGGVLFLKMTMRVEVTYSDYVFEEPAQP